MKKTAFMLALCLFTAGCALAGPTAAPTASPGQPRQVAGDGSAASELVYRNAEYGFEFRLPLSWQGYTIVPGEWQGMAAGASEGRGPVEKGPILSIRHPKWTEKVPRQDIPIMIFTTAQWNALQADNFHIGAAPVGPRELGRNSQYVFALPARYNYAFAPGFEEVEQILADQPLYPTEPNRKGS